MRRAAGSVAVAGLLLVTGGCGARVEVLGVRFGDECPVVARTVSPLVVPEEEGSLVVIVSNQSFEDPVVRLTVSVDGEVVVDQELDVCGQHAWASFPLRVQPGWHDVEARTDGDVSTTGRIELPAAPARRWVVLSHWTDPDPRVDLEQFSEPPGFG
ncbi:hypothetical protein [Oryzobacter terrae]|uniref:hypothetical protein n=1 Tax=Oryzobacter terrae TaxID=1620385 RepID=UPI00366DDCA0